MRKLRAKICLLPLLVCLAGLANFSCHRTEPRAQRGPDLEDSLNDHLASRLLGRQVENEDGQELATLSDLLLDFHTGRVRYALLSSGGFLGLGKRRSAVPWEALSVETTKKNVLALDIAKPAWDEAPGLKGKPVIALSSPILVNTIDRYYLRAAKQNDVLLPPDAVSAIASAPTPAGHEPGSISPTLRLSLQSARALIGTPVADRHQQRIGRIRDFLVDLSDLKTDYAIISGRQLGRHKRFAISLPLLNRGEGHTFLVDANRSMFEQAQRFDPASWHSNRLEIGKILRFSENEPAETVNSSTLEPALAASK